MVAASGEGLGLGGSLAWDNRVRGLQVPQEPWGKICMSLLLKASGSRIKLEYILSATP